MVEQPAGTVTLVFTDIEGSTRLLQDLGQDSFMEALAVHRVAVRDAFESYGGYEVDYEGDSFFYAFSSADAAVAAVAEAMGEMECGPIRIRVGIHTGKPGLDPPKYVGVDVHLAARVMSAGRGGQVLLSAATTRLVGASVTNLGEHRLKDFDEPVEIFQLGDGTFPPLKTISNTNLPRPASSFVGREREVAEIVALTRTGVRLLTLSGPGGSGKTRLAIEAAAELLQDFEAGVFWVGLAALRDPALMTETIVHSLGAKEGLAKHIGERKLLLLLDNLEQIIDVAPELSALISACPNLTLLVTSRELLRVQGEVEYPVPPLTKTEAVTLLCARASVEENEAVSELCSRLDNLPLALELAAGRMSVLSAAQILERLAQRLDLLKAGRDADPRQLTLRATIRWSYDLLTEREQALFTRLSVFASGCTVETAEQIVEADLNDLQGLVDKNLVRIREAEIEAKPRFWMLETIREYASERLRASGEADELAARHALWFLALAEEAQPHLRGPEQMTWLRRLDEEHDNLRAALDYLAGSEQYELELRLAGSLTQFWYVRSHLSEGRDYLERALQRHGGNPTRFLEQALYGGLLIAHRRGDYERARVLADERLVVARSLGDEPAIAFALLGCGLAAEALGERERSAEYNAECVELARRHDDRRTLAMALNNLGLNAAREGDHERARRYVEESLALFRELADTRHVAAVLTALGGLALEQGRSSEARTFAVEGLEIAYGLEDNELITWCLESLAAQAATSKQPDRAARLLSSADRLREDTGFVEQLDERQRNARTREALNTMLDEQRLGEALVRGREMTLDEAVAHALESDQVGL
jgi:predicted ATPase